MEHSTSSESRRILKRFLSQYYRAKQRKVTLTRRLAEMRKELRNPGISSPPLDRPAIGDNSHGDGTLAMVIRVEDIEEKLQRQVVAQAKIISEIMDVLDCLPNDSTEREILEYRHLDCKSWEEIWKLVHLTKSPCFERYNKGLDKLLECEKVKATLAAYKARLEGESAGN